MPSEAAMRAVKTIFCTGLLEDHPIGHPLLSEAAEIVDRHMQLSDEEVWMRAMTAAIQCPVDYKIRMCEVADKALENFRIRFRK